MKLRAARFSLPPGAADELLVNPPGLVPLGANHVQAAQLLHMLADQNIRAAAGHVGRHRNYAFAAGVGYLPSLMRFALGIHNLVMDIYLVEISAHSLGNFNAARADQNRLPLIMPFFDVPRQP